MTGRDIAISHIKVFLRDKNDRRGWGHPVWSEENFLMAVIAKIGHRKRYRAIQTRRRDTTKTHQRRRTLLDAFLDTDMEMRRGGSSNQTLLAAKCEAMVWRKARQNSGCNRPAWCVIPMMSHAELMVVLWSCINDIHSDARAAELYRTGELLPCERAEELEGAL